MRIPPVARQAKIVCGKVASTTLLVSTGAEVGELGTVARPG